jgi:hypothetical protein
MPTVVTRFLDVGWIYEVVMKFYRNEGCMEEEP